MSRDLGAAIGLTLLWAAFTTVTALVAPQLVPGIGPLEVGLFVILVVSVLVASALRLGAAREFRVLGRPRAPVLLILPAALTLLPLAGGLGWPGAGTAGVLLLGYALTGFAEEAVFRGFVLDRLSGLGPRGAAGVQAVLFGAVHLPNILVRGQVGPILGQAVGAACFGFGYAALRGRTGPLWPLMLLHFATDLLLRLGQWPVIPLAVAQDVVLLAYGFWLMRGTDRP